jgi:hypothetical protein
MHMEPFTHDAYKEAYTEDEDFKEVFQQLQGQIHIEEGDNKDDYHFQNGLLYKLDKLCVPKGEHCSLSERLTPPRLQDILVLGRQFPTYRGMCTGPECKKM